MELSKTGDCRPGTRAHACAHAQASRQAETANRLLSFVVLYRFVVSGKENPKTNETKKIALPAKQQEERGLKEPAFNLSSLHLKRGAPDATAKPNAGRRWVHRRVAERDRHRTSMCAAPRTTARCTPSEATGRRWWAHRSSEGRHDEGRVATLRRHDEGSRAPTHPPTHTHTHVKNPDDCLAYFASFPSARAEDASCVAFDIILPSRRGVWTKERNR